MDNQQAKCLRIVVTSFFDDGSSAVIDIPEPEKVTDESRVIEPENLTYDFSPPFIMSTQVEFVLKVRANPDIPVRVMTLPIPGSNT